MQQTNENLNSNKKTGDVLKSLKHKKTRQRTGFFKRYLRSIILLNPCTQ